MKKNIFILIGLLFIQCELFSQGPNGAGIRPLDTNKYTVLDSANYKFTYEFTYTPDSTKTIDKLKNELILLVGNNESKFFSSILSEKPKEVKQTTHSDARAMQNGSGLNGTEVYKNLKTGQETVTTRVFGTLDVFTYNEPIPDFNWVISNETKEILSYSCRKATTVFRGREYEAWFTTDIPLNNGPWKFGGLPGLILRVSDTNNYFIFECQSIEMPKEKDAIVKYDWKYVPSTRKDVNNLIKNMHHDMKQVAISMGRTPLYDKAPPFPYNPLEKEY